MKKAGFTLIELMVALSVLACITSISFLSYKFIKEIEDKQKIVQSISSLEDTITFARLYCIKNKKEGYILVDIPHGSYGFYQDKTGYAKPIKKGVLTGRIRFLCMSNNYNNEIRISPSGIPVSGTISMAGDNNKIYKISIGVGNSNEEKYN